MGASPKVLSTGLFRAFISSLFYHVCVGILLCAIYCQVLYTIVYTAIYGLCK